MMQDDRTPDQKLTHTIGIVGTDSFMSGWGKTQGGHSYAVWACEPGNVAATLSRIENRGDMKRVRVVTLNGYRPRAAHTHIYLA